MLTPLIFIVILNRSVFAQHSTYFLPGAIAYALFGVLAGLYNVFGADGLGVQVYLLAPIRLRDVIVAKNLMSLAIIGSQAGLAWVVASVLARNSIPLSTQISTALWTVFVIAANLAVGTVRSIQAPRKFVPGQAQQRRGTPTNRTSGLLDFPGLVRQRDTAGSRDASVPNLPRAVAGLRGSLALSPPLPSLLTRFCCATPSR